MQRHPDSRIRPPVAVGLLIASLAASSLAASVQAEVEEAIEIGTRGNAESARSQDRIDKLDDEKDALLQQFRRELAQIESLQVYNRQLEDLVAAQEVERTSILDQIDQVTLVGREITPLMIRMVESLEKFVELDVPFLQEERRERIAGLRELLGRSDVADSERFRRILEAFQVENEYGRTIEAYRGEIDLEGQTLLVDFLRFGRLALLYQSADGRRTGIWDRDRRAWQELGAEYRIAVRDGLRIARKQRAPDLIMLPIPAPSEAK